MRAVAAGFHRLDLVHHVLAFHHFAKHAVAPALQVFGGEVQRGVVSHVDEELGGGRVRGHGARHGDGVRLVGQAVVGFVGDGFAGGLLHHAAGKATALDHEAIDHAVKQRAVVVAVAHVFFEVGHGLGGFFRVQLQGDVTQGGGQLDHVESSSSKNSRRRPNAGAKWSSSGGQTPPTPGRETRARRDYSVFSTTAFSITTALTGISWYMPRVVVGVLAMRSTTSMPWVTRPNTA